MNGVDYAGVVLDLRGRLGDRQSWSARQLRELIDDLEQSNRLEAPAAAPSSSPTAMSAAAVPLAPGDPLWAQGAMDTGADSDPEPTEPS